MYCICLFQSNTKILELDLSDNWLGQKGGIAVCEMLKENCFITNLVSTYYYVFVVILNLNVTYMDIFMPCFSEYLRII